MNDDLKLSPETAALAALAGRVANAAFDKALEGDLDGFDTEVDNAMAEALLSFNDEDAARQEEMLTFGKQFMRLNAASVKAFHEGSSEESDRLHAESKVLQARVHHLTLYRGFTDAAERLHIAKGFDDFMAILPEVDLTRTYGNSIYNKISPFPLIWAMEARDKALERVQAMLNAGARLDLTATFAKLSVLHWMAQTRRKGRDKRLAILRLLLLKGADLEAKDRHGRTPLHMAITQGSADEVAIFLEAGSDARAIFVIRAPFPFERSDVTTLMMAADDPEKMQLLLNHGADPAQCGADGWDLLAHLRKELAQAKQGLMERPEKKRAGSAYEKLRNARAESLALVEAH